MKLLTVPRISPEDKCPYLENLNECHEFFFAEQIKKDEMDFLLAKGWRKFGQFLFRPRCPSCSKCIPLRILTKEFEFKKSVRRIINKNSDIEVVFSPLTYREDHFRIYRKHSDSRFNDKQIEREEDYIQTFYTYTGTQVMSEFFLDGELVAFGILDRGSHSLSSVYFVFDPDYANRSLGKFGIIKEVEYARHKNMSYYYLGYWIEENKSMRYKSAFKPYETYNWLTKVWTRHDMAES
ncbi:arginyltransferase [Bacteriovorax sp. DB6_IX]|uniref:arginyltransferase n=1 Tax=Bacteriovorax sp. DB6_IX TaxID=1353530 RepID=UPI00038A4FE7|nr:arginyltransferase [Bacteriovorax sp. DB6_IX]EQC51039.1 arginyltransferase, C-terminal domain protein [Bacteriovorax sp. DB6_IX]